MAAAEHLLARGAPFTLATALCLVAGRMSRALRAPPTRPEANFGFVLAALNGRADALRRMLELGVDVNAPSGDLYSHGTPLHHAVCSGSLAAVQVLVEAGAGLATKDTAWDATPLGWAEYYLAGSGGKRDGKQDAEIVAYLRASQAATG